MRNKVSSKSPSAFMSTHVINQLWLFGSMTLEKAICVQAFPVSAFQM